MAARLAVRAIPHQLSPDGATLLVPEDQLDASRIETATQGLPRGARLGFELFDTPNWAGTDFSEKVNYQRALEGELERTLGTLSDVEAVRVHLVMPQESLFTAEERVAKAAVIVKTRSGGLSERAQRAIPQLVASAVDRLLPENVTVVDADSNQPLLAARVGSGGRDLNPADEAMAQTLVRTLEPVVGVEHVRASVHIEYDMSSSENTQETYDPKATAALTQERSDESSTAGAPAGVPGTASNVPSASSNAAAGASSVPPGVTADQSTSHSEASTFAVSKTLHRSTEPPGRIRRIAAAVLVDDRVELGEAAGKPTVSRTKRTVEEMKQIEDLARAALGISADRGDVLVVENIAFREAPAEAVTAPTKVERWRKLAEPWTWTLRYVVVGVMFLAVYWLVLKPVKKHAIEAFQALPGKAAAAAASERVQKQGSDLPLAAGAESAAGRTQQLRQVLADKVKSEPASAGRLVQAWLREGAGK